MSDAPPPHALLRPRIALPFLLTALIWGSTWYVITGQIADASASWSIAWRFMIATPAMFLVALLMRRPLALGPRGQMLAVMIGLFQFCGNFNFVYRSEMHLTSGIVAVMFSIVFVPNALLGRAMLGEPISGRFLLGSLVALSGIALLLVHEARVSPLGGNVVLGIGLGMLGMLSASFANIIQAGSVGRVLPMASLLAWSMLYGTAFNIAIAWWAEGVPVLPVVPAFWYGLVWLALAGSVVTFPLYYQLVRELGAGRAAYNGVAVVIIAMLISTLAEGYGWSLLAIGGALLALFGLLIALRARQA
ncbi:DMT family transporter [Altererythrobacter arenosus]|uniref:DMT family transporter n=1 Tax=Altererythrobacter arenosus TaxID=3032592 RepID=A0ABY8FZM0_9SPHN|nr:DMT family transporter [Altererythrobacter sp. CAU 1644]WFL78771.1 DMT family transporter [Altererythrobacter sp. CAU 1644]